MKKIIIFMPAYNAEETLESVWKKIPEKYKKNTFLIDDNSKDNTYDKALSLGIESYKNNVNLGYGGNIKKCLKKALDKKANIIVEMHPDNEYDPQAIEPAVQVVTQQTGMVLGNRSDALKSGMYLWKYIATKILTFIDNFILKIKISDLHQGFRLYTKEFLNKIPFEKNSNNYLFSFEIIAQCVYYKFVVKEINVKTNYTGKKRGASFKNSFVYTLGTFKILILFMLANIGIKKPLFD